VRESRLHRGEMRRCCQHRRDDDGRPEGQEQGARRILSRIRSRDAQDCERGEQRRGDPRADPDHWLAVRAVIA
jgi:hypothetical protein